MKRITRNTCLIAMPLFSALTASPALGEFGYYESFEDSSIGWLPLNSTVTAVSSGTNGIDATDGSFYGLIGPGASSAQTGAFDSFGANNATFGVGFTAGTDIYIDLSDANIAAGTYGFDYSIAINDNNGDPAQDNIFHVGAVDDGNGGFDLAINASHNTDFLLNTFKINNSPFGTSPEVFTDSGWYTFQVTFTPSASPDAVDVLFEVLDEAGDTFFSATTQNGPAQYTLSTAGGDRYGWLTYVETDSGLAVDSTFVNAVPEPASLALLGLGGLALLRRRTRSDED
ncbi:MAG: PEP-CTERM sorting domain-containing protein [Planctomycetota bacterium]